LQLRPEREAQLVHLVASKQVDGVILLNGEMIGSDGLSIEDLNVPIVAVGVPAKSPIPAVLVQDRKAAADIARHLLKLGHRHFGYVTGPEGYVDNERWQGFMTTLAEAGISVESVPRYPGDFAGPSGIRAAELFLAEKDKPTAVFAVSDMMAIGFMRTLRAAGIDVPSDVSVVGFDGIEFAEYCEPRLTTMQQPSEAMGSEAARLLMRLIGGETIPQAERWKRLEVELLHGSSTAPPPKP
jgi:LacI family repressor for deo operon, udp, cdd, tsx, nupC, and nupG